MSRWRPDSRWGTADLVIDVTGWWRYGTFSFSIITRYEILRGLKAKNAIVQLRAFDRLCAGSQIVPLTDGAVVKASEIYAELRRRGEYPARKDLPPFRRARRRGSRGGIY
jgi:predicted nucleic acid-binding protein